MNVFMKIVLLLDYSINKAPGDYFISKEILIYY